MSNDYVTSILVHQRLSELQHEAAVERLAREARQGQPRRRWWERLMLFHSASAPTAPTVHTAPTAAEVRRVPQVPRVPAATVATDDSPC